MDIEGGEYDWIMSLNTQDLCSFKQIVIEVHGVNNDSWGTPYRIKHECLKRLSETHYLVHAHGNNARSTTNYIPNVFELTYIRKNEVSSEPPLNTRALPDLTIDFPNNINRPDHILDIPPFTNTTNY